MADSLGPRCAVPFGLAAVASAVLVVGVAFVPNLLSDAVDVDGDESVLRGWNIRRCCGCCACRCGPRCAQGAGCRCTCCSYCLFTAIVSDVGGGSVVVTANCGV